MAKDCYLCKTKTIFYIWSTSRNFPREELAKKKGLISRAELGILSRDGVPVCFKCYEELKNKKRNE